MEENENNVLPTNQQSVIQYKGNQILVKEPENADNRYVAYIRPGDLIDINFDIKPLKVDVTRGDVVIIFPNGSTVTLASMASLAFGENAPSLKSKEGVLLSLEEFLNKTEVLDYNQAVLILSNRDELKLSDDKPDVVKTASSINENLDAGTPISGVGESEVLYKGVVNPRIDPTATTLEDRTSDGKGNFVATINTSNSPYTKDQDNDKPGQRELTDKPNVTSKLLFGSSLDAAGNVTLNNGSSQSAQYKQYVYSNGQATTDDKYSQIAPNVLDLSSSTENIFVNNNTSKMVYDIEVSYLQGIFPKSISLVIPKGLKDKITLSDGGTGAFSSIVEDSEGNLVYNVDNLDPTGKMVFEISFAQNTPITVFDLLYYVDYLNPSTGKIETIDITLNLVITPASTEADLDQNTNVLSSTPNGVDVKTGSGDDIIIGGGGNNIISAGSGNNRVFSGVANDIITLEGNGNNKYWASIGADIIQGAKDGKTTVYYDNHVDDIDSNNSDFKKEYYNTYETKNALNGYLGMKAADIFSLFPNDPNLAEFIDKAIASTKDGSSFIGKYSGFDLMNDISEIFFSKGSDTINLSSYSNQMITLHGMLGNSESGIRDNLVIHSGFNDGKGAIIDLTANYKDLTGDNVDALGNEVSFGTIGTVSIKNDDGSAGDIKYTFDGFEMITGGSGDDIIYAEALKANEQKALGQTYTFWFDGGAGTNTLSYAKAKNLSSIVFDAGSGKVEINTGNPADIQWHQVNNINIFEGSMGSDTFYGGIVNYKYKGGEGSGATGKNNTLTYEKSAAVTYNLNNGYIYKNTIINKDDNAINEEELNAKGHDEILDDSFSITLSKNDDVVIATEKGAYAIEGGGGYQDRDVLTYQYIGKGLTVIIDDNGNLSAELDGRTGADTAKNYDIYQIIGANAKTIFYGSKGEIAKGNYFVGKYIGDTTTEDTTTLSYDKVTGTGISFKIGGESNSVEKSGGGTDSFSNIFRLIGTGQDDVVWFTDRIQSIAEINKYNIDLGGGINTVNLSQISAGIVSGSNNNSSIQVKYDAEGQLQIFFGYQSNGSWVIDDSNKVILKNTQGVVGTSRDDEIVVTDNVKQAIFDGYVGNDIANYTNVTKDTVYDLTETDSSKGNVYRGGTVTVDTAGNLVINGIAQDDADRIYNTTTIKGGSGVNTFLGTGDPKSYKFFGGDSGEDTLDYSKSTTGVSVYFENSTVKKSLGGEDTFDDKIVKVKGSKNNDTFYAYDNSGGTAKTIVVDGGYEGASDIDIMDFSKIKSAMDITLEKGKESIVEGGNITWKLNSIEGLVLGDFGNNLTLIGEANYSITGGTGTDSVIYNKDTEVTHLTVAIGGDITVTKYNGNTNSGLDTLKKVEELDLTEGDDRVDFSAGHGSNDIKKIDGLGGNNEVNFATVALDLTIDIAGDGSFSLSGLENNKVIELINFSKITASDGKTTINISESFASSQTSYLTLAGSGLEGKLSTVDFSKAKLNGTNGITLTLSSSIQNGVYFDKVEGAIAVDYIVFSNINKFVLTSGDDYVYGSIDKDINFGTTGNGGFIGNGGKDTLDYSRLTSSAGVVLNVSESRVYKGGTEYSYDEFENFSKFVGTDVNDTVVINNLDDSISLEIELGKGDNVISVKTSSAVTYNMQDEKIIVNGKELDTANIQATSGTLNLELSDNDDTLIYTSKSTPKFINIDAGDGSSGDILDASASTNSIVFFANYNNTGFDRIYSGVLSSSDDFTALSSKVEDTLYSNFNIIKGSSTARNIFYTDSVSQNDFRGGASKEDTLSYENSKAGVTINLGSGSVDKGGYADKFSGIEIFEGSKNSDIYLFNSSFFAMDESYINSVKIKTHDSDDPNISAKDQIQFDVNKNIDLIIDGNSSGVAVDGKQYTISFDDVAIFQMQDPNKASNNTVNTVTVKNSEKNLTLAGANASVASPGIYKDTLTYTQGNVTFNTLSGSITRAGTTGTSFTDTFKNFGVLQYTGSGSVVFNGSIGQAYTFIGNNQDAKLSYSTVSDAITVDLVNSNITIASAGKVDTFKDITVIQGGTGNDKFILAKLPEGSSKIVLDGGAGVDTASLENMYTETSPVIKLSEFTGATGTGYELRNIESYGLTERDDTLIVDNNESFDIDGLGGTNAVDFTQLPFLANIEFDFVTGSLIIYNTTDESQTNSNLENFHSAQSGDGDDSFTVGNDQISDKYRISAGGGNNSLNFAAVTYAMEVEYGASDVRDFSVKYSGTGAPSATQSYQSFSTIILSGATGNTLNYNYDQSHSDANNPKLSFSGGNSSIDQANATFTFKAKAAQTFYINLDTTGGIVGLDKNVTQDNAFLTVQYFKNYVAGSNASLYIFSTGLSSYNLTGGSGDDTIDYSSSTVTNLVAEITDANSKSIKVTSNSNAVGEIINNFETIILKADSKLILKEHTGSKILNVDMIEGGTISFEGYSSAIKGSIAAPTGYTIKGADKYTLTTFDDELDSVENQTTTIDGATGSNTMNYITGFSNSVDIQYGGGDTYTVLKSEGSYSDTLRNMAFINLSTDFANKFTINANDFIKDASGNYLTVDMGEARESDANKKDIVDLSSTTAGIQLNLSSSNEASSGYIKGLFTNITTNNQININNAETINLGTGNDTLTVSKYVKNISINGGGGRNTLDMSSYATTYSFDYNLITGVVSNSTYGLGVKITNFAHIIGNIGNGVNGGAKATYYIGVNNAESIRESFTIDLRKEDKYGQEDTRVYYNEGNFTNGSMYSPEAVTFNIGEMVDGYLATVVDKTGSGSTEYKDTLYNPKTIIGTGKGDTFVVKQLLTKSGTATSEKSTSRDFYTGTTQKGGTLDLSAITQNLSLDFAYSGSALGGAQGYIQVAAGGDYRDMNFYSVETLKLGSGENTYSFNLGWIANPGVTNAVKNLTTTIDGSAGSNDTIVISGDLYTNPATINLDLTTESMSISLPNIADPFLYDIKGIENFKFGASANKSTLNLKVDENSTAKEVWLNGDSKLDMTAFSVDNKITLNYNSTNGYYITTEKGNNYMNIANISLGEKNDTLTILAASSSTGGLGTIDAGAGTSQSVNFGNTTSKIDLSGKSFRLDSSSTTLEDSKQATYMTFSNFQTLDFANATASSGISVYISDNYGGTIKTINGSVASATSLLFQNKDGTDFSGNITIVGTKSNGNQLSSNNMAISFSNINSIILGSGGDKVTLDSLSGYTLIDGGAGTNTFSTTQSSLTATFSNNIFTAGSTQIKNMENISVGLDSSITIKDFNNVDKTSLTFETLGHSTLNIDVNMNITNITGSVTDSQSSFGIFGSKNISAKGFYVVRLHNQENKAYNYQVGSLSTTTEMTMEIGEVGVFKQYVSDNILDFSALEKGTDIFLTVAPSVGNKGYEYQVTVGGSGQDSYFIGFGKVLFGAGNDTVIYNTTTTYDNNVGSDYQASYIFEGGDGNNTVDLSSSDYSYSSASMGGSIVRGGGIVDTFNNFQNVILNTKANLTIGDSLLDSLMGKSIDSKGFEYAKLSSEDDNIYIRGMDPNKVIDTGSGGDHIYLTGEASGFTFDEVLGDYVTIDGKEYETGGVYLIIYDDEGNAMYLLNADKESIVIGGKDTVEDESQLQSTYDPNIDYSTSTYSNSTNEKQEDTSNQENQDSATTTVAYSEDSSDNQDSSYNSSNQALDSLFDFNSLSTLVAYNNDSNNVDNYNAIEGQANIAVLESEETIDSMNLDTSEIANQEEDSNNAQEENNDNDDYVSDLNEIINDNVITNEINESDIENNYKLDSEGNGDPSKNHNDNLYKNLS